VVIHLVNKSSLLNENFNHVIKIAIFAEIS
jgi:hypothetical protein